MKLTVQFEGYNPIVLWRRLPPANMDWRVADGKACISYNEPKSAFTSGGRAGYLPLGGQGDRGRKSCMRIPSCSMPRIPLWSVCRLTRPVSSRRSCRAFEPRLMRRGCAIPTPGPDERGIHKPCRACTGSSTWDGLGSCPGKWSIFSRKPMFLLYQALLLPRQKSCSIPTLMRQVIALQMQSGPSVQRSHGYRIATVLGTDCAFHLRRSGTEIARPLRVRFCLKRLDTRPFAPARKWACRCKGMHHKF